MPPSYVKFRHCVMLFIKEQALHIRARYLPVCKCTGMNLCTPDNNHGNYSK